MNLTGTTKMESFFDDLHQRIPLLRRSTIENIQVPQIYIPGSDYDPDYIRAAQIKLSSNRDFFKFSQRFAKEFQSEIEKDLLTPAAFISSQSQIQNIINTTQRSLHFFINHLSEITKQILQPKINSHLKKFLENCQGKMDRKSFFENQVRRLAKIRRDELKKNPFLADGIKAFYHTLEFGFKNIIKRTWSFFTVIPSVFFAKYKRLPNPDEYRGIARSSFKLISLMASEQDDLNNLVHSIISRPYIIKDQKDDIKMEKNLISVEGWKPLHPNDFELDENDELAFSPELMRDIGNECDRDFQSGKISLDEARIGCPAQAIMAVIFNVCFRLAEKTMFNNPERIYQLNLRNGDI